MSKVWITNANGASFAGCECLRDWWPLVTRMAVKRGIVTTCLDVTQGSYNGTRVAASAGTHSGGGTLDLRQYSDSTVRLLREAGAASWKRTPAQGFAYHNHLVLNGCPHNSPARYQVQAWLDGYNGLGYMGRRYRDDGPDVGFRTWSEGVAWMKRELGVAVTPAAAGRPTTSGALPQTGGEGPTPVSYTAAMRAIRGGYKASQVRIIQEQLKGQRLYTYNVDSLWGPKTRAAYAKYQQACGYSGAGADGIPGPSTFKRLMAWSGNYRAVA